MVYQKNTFSKFANGTAHFSGHPITFLTALSIIAIWAFTGPIFQFSDTWQLVINTGTTIVTFLMVFLIQNTQNRDSYAIQLKLDELIRATKGAHTSLLDIEELTEKDILILKKQYIELAERAREELRKGRGDEGTPKVKSIDKKLTGK